MKKLYVICFHVLRMPLILIGIGLLALVGPEYFSQNINAVLMFIMSGISIFIQFFTDTYFFKRGMQTASIGFILIGLYLYFGHESQIWVIAMRIIGLGAALFFLLDVHEQWTNYQKLRKKSIEYLVRPLTYQKLATSRCSMNMFFAVLDEVHKREYLLASKNYDTPSEIGLRRSTISAWVCGCKEIMKLIYKPWFFFPKTTERLWIKKLKQLLGKDPKGKRKKKLKNF